MIQMKAVLAGNAALAQIEAVRKEWKKGLLEERNEIHKLYKHTTSTWKNNRPRFYSKFGENATSMWVEVYSENRIYWFVHEGIAVMHAIFSDDWHPKTIPGRLTPRAGRGKLVRVRPEYKGPLYEPRKFTDLIVKARKKPFEKRMQHATAVGARKATQGG